MTHENPALAHKKVLQKATAPDADGRNIDPALGTLRGEGGAISVDRPETAWPLRKGGHGEAIEIDPQAGGDPDLGDTYYGLPALKEPVWKWYIPAYLYVGGAAGASAALGAAAQLAGGAEMRSLALATRFLGVTGSVLSAAFLIADLGRPSRFLNMLRVFRPTSPMNLGSWVLSTFGAASAASTLLSFAPGRLGRLGDRAALVAGAAGLPLAGYTAVLISNTAVPVWQGAARSLPFLFVSSATSAAASLLELGPSFGKRADRAVRLFGVMGKACELVAARAMHVELGPGTIVERPLRHGRSALLYAASAALTAGSLAASLIPSRSPLRKLASAVLGTAGAMALRYALIEAGRASAREPRATFEPQRQQLEARSPATEVEGSFHEASAR